MNKNNIIYWATTAIVSFMMLFSAYSYFTDPVFAGYFVHMGFPDYFRVELGWAKILGVAALLIPQVPRRVKEWAYAGFGFVFISAIWAHLSSGDGMGAAVMPGVLLGVLAVSNYFLDKKEAAA